MAASRLAGGTLGTVLLVIGGFGHMIAAAVTLQRSGAPCRTPRNLPVAGAAWLLRVRLGSAPPAHGDHEPHDQTVANRPRCGGAPAGTRVVRSRRPFWQSDHRVTPGKQLHRSGTDGAIGLSHRVRGQNSWRMSASSINSNSRAFQSSP